MFQRRHKHTLTRRLRESLWPSAGWIRTLTYWTHRLIRLQATPYSIAAGLATGMAVSVTPLIGLHIVFILLICWAIGGNFLAGVIGSLVGNPWTFPFIWMFIYRVGCLMLGLEPGLPAEFEISFAGLVSNPVQSLAPAVGPMLVGAIPTALLVWASVFFAARRFVALRQRHRRQRMKAAPEREDLASKGEQ